MSSNFDPIHDLPIPRIRLGNAESKVMLPLRIYCPGERDRLVVSLDSYVRVCQDWLAIDFVLNLLLLDLGS